MKKSILSACVIGTLAMSFAASSMASDTGTTRFSGVIGADSCIITMGTGPGGLGQTIKFPALPANQVEDAAHWAPVSVGMPFDYQVNGCPKSFKAAIATFTFTPDGAANNIINNSGSGKGLGVAITKKPTFTANDEMKNGDSISSPIVDGSATIQAYAYLLRDLNAVVTGPITATTDVTISYN